MEISLAEIAKKVSGQLTGNGKILIHGLADLGSAGSGQISFFANPKYKNSLDNTRASAVIVSKDFAPSRKDIAWVKVENPNLAFSKVISLFAPETFVLEKGIHPQAQVAKGAKLGRDVRVGAFAVIGENVKIGAHSEIHSGVFLGPDSKVGEHCVLYPHVCIRERVSLGNRVIVHCGTVIGSDGFGFEFVKGHWEKIPQCGTVEIEDDVEIGANCAIDRGRFGSTRIGKGTKLDNLVHVAHNVQVGHDALLIAQVGISGSAEIGNYVILAGQAGVSGHIRVGDGAKVAGGSGVMGDAAPGEELAGVPAIPFREWIKSSARFRKLSEQAEELRNLKRRIEKLEKKRS